MSAKTYKILMFMKRRPGMSVEDFRRYYEDVHAKLALKYSRGITRYTRRFLNALPNPETGDTSELAYDVITEIWFEDEKLWKGTVHYISTSIMPDEITTDEANLFDRPKIRAATVVEYDSDLSGLGK